MTALPRTPSRSRLGLTHEAIIDAASELLDEQGLPGVTMRRVAERLGIGTMTLYGYFPDKDALLDAIIDATDPGPVASSSSGPWKPRLRELMLALHEQLIRHPFVVELRLRRPIVSPQAMRWTEAALEILTGAGLSPGEAAKTFRPLFVYTFGHAAFLPREDPDHVSNRARSDVLSLPPKDYPLVSAAASELAAVLIGQEPYELGLDLLLDGIQARLDGR